MSKKHILQNYVKRIKGTDDTKKSTTIVPSDKPNTLDDGVRRTETFYSYFIYDNTNNKIIGNIYLTENQAYSINDLLKRTFKKENPDIMFVRS